MHLTWALFRPMSIFKLNKTHDNKKLKEKVSDMSVHAEPKSPGFLHAFPEPASFLKKFLKKPLFPGMYGKTGR